MNFKCPLCAYSKESIELMQVHCVKAHPKEFVTCPWCTKPYGNIYMLQKHSPNCPDLDKNEPREGRIDSVLISKDMCLECEGRFSSEDAALQHYKEQHLNFTYICDVCKDYFQRKKSLDDHVATHRANAPMDAAPLRETVNSKRAASSRATRGTTRNNQKRTASTAFASKTLDDQATRSSPRKVKKNIRDFRHGQKILYMQWFNMKHCYGCKLDFDSTVEIAEHFRIDHKTAVFICDICDKAYLSTYINEHKKAMHPDKTSTQHVRQNSEIIPPPDDTDATNEQLFECPHRPCQFKGTGGMVLEHVRNRHILRGANEGDVKSENGNEQGSTSTLDAEVLVKTEPDGQAMTRAPRPNRKTTAGSCSPCDEIVDLTQDDD